MPRDLVLLAPLVGGFLLLKCAYLYRYRTQRMNGYELLLASMAVGFGLGLAARLIFNVIELALRPAAVGWDSFLSLQFEQPEAALALILSLLLAGSINHFNPAHKAKEKALAVSGDRLNLLLFKASTNSRLVRVVLRNGDVFVGYGTSTPNLVPEGGYVQIVPILRGRVHASAIDVSAEAYRDAVSGDSSDMLDSRYDDVFAGTAIRLDEIHFASLFDFERYYQHARSTADQRRQT